MPVRSPRATALIPPALATRVDVVPEGAEWLHEPKLDGYRIQCHVKDRTATLLTRNGLDWSAKFPALSATALGIAPRKDLILDGEVVMPTGDGASPFQALQGAVKAGATSRAIYWVFDLLRFDGLDLRSLPLSERRAALLSVFSQQSARSRIRVTKELRGRASALLAAACANGEEGVISKRRDAAYHSGRSHDWLKIKCGQQDEFIVVGYTAPKGSRTHIGALLLASRAQGARTLRYVGRVGSGFSDELLRDLAARLRVQATAPTRLEIPAAHGRGVTWVEPELVVNVTFAEWTTDGLLRQATFGGIREDKTVKEVAREVPVPSATVAVSHGERVVFPERGVRKIDIASYYAAVAPLMLPHLGGRPLSLLRCPDGAHGHCFFQKHWTPTRGVSIPTRDVSEADGSSDPYAVIATADDLVALVQMNVIEIHAWGSRFPNVEKPDRLVLDLDPGPGVEWPAVCEAARRARDLLSGIGLTSWVKLSGGKGLHVTVPFTGRLSWDQLSLFSKLLATRLAAEDPSRYTVSMAKSARPKRIFIDWMRNSRGATAASPWSVRAREGAPIAIPLTWTELDDVPRGDLMLLPDVTEYLRASPSDPWSDLLSTKQSLTAAMVQQLGAAND
ncbi:MAG: DNA ligase D [Gemmatimonadaceae bacterium]|nr:DNA ligase D [Gemmatimonadaceae bacterium]